MQELPKPPFLLMRGIRSVDTPRVPRTLVQDLSQRLSDQIARSGSYTVVETSTVPSGSEDAAPADCLTEACELTAAKQMVARSVLHTRLVQYAEQCVLLGALYETETGKNEWAWAKQFACDSAGVETAINEMGTAFLGTLPEAPSGPIWAVVPIQHNIEDLAYASESYAEYLTTLLASGGKVILPASTVATHLDAGKKDPAKACGDKKCAIKVSFAAGAAHGVAAKITKKKNTCTVSAAVYNVATKTSTQSASADGGCAAGDIATALKTIADKFNEVKEKPPVPADTSEADAQKEAEAAAEPEKTPEIEPEPSNEGDLK